MIQIVRPLQGELFSTVGIATTPLFKVNIMFLCWT